MSYNTMLIDRRTTNIADMIAGEMRGLIVRGVFSPGEHLGQARLADRFSVSRVPVREALKLLAAEGLVTHGTNRGSCVAKVSADEARQLCRLRRWIEVELLTTAEWPNEDELRSIERQLMISEASLAMRDRTAWHAHLREARRAILDLSPQKALLRAALRLWTLTDRYRSMLPLPTPRRIATTRGSMRCYPRCGGGTGPACCVSMNATATASSACCSTSWTRERNARRTNFPALARLETFSSSMALRRTARPTPPGARE